jgi:hypothetical protein
MKKLQFYYKKKPPGPQIPFQIPPNNMKPALIALFAAGVRRQCVAVGALTACVALAGGSGSVAVG